MAAGVLFLDRETRSDLTSSRQSIIRTYEVERAFQSVQTTVTELENSQRGFLLTAEPRDLAAYEQGRVRLDEAMERLGRVSAADVGQRARAREMTELTRRQVTALEEIVMLARTGRRDEAQAQLERNGGTALTDRIRELTAEARNQELSLLAVRQQTFDAALLRRRRLMQLLMVTALVVTIAAFWMVTRLQRLASYVTMCAWSRTIEMGGEWVTFEEYLLRRFNVNVSHGVAPPEMAKLLEQVKSLDATPGPSVPPFPGKQTDSAVPRNEPRTDAFA